MRVSTASFLVFSMVAMSGCGGSSSGTTPPPKTDIGTYTLRGANTATDVSSVSAKIVDSSKIADGVYSSTMAPGSGFMKQMMFLQETEGVDGLEKLTTAFGKLEEGQCNEFFTNLNEGFDLPKNLSQLKTALAALDTPAKVSAAGCTSLPASGGAFHYSCNPAAEGGAGMVGASSVSGSANSNEVAVTQKMSLALGEGSSGVKMDVELGVYGNLSEQLVRMGMRVNMALTEDGREGKMDVAHKATFQGGTQPSIAVETTALGSGGAFPQGVDMSVNWSLRRESENVVAISVSGNMPDAKGASQTLQHKGTVTRVGSTCTYKAQ